MPERPYQEVEIDFTPMDVILVAESGALLGRPYLVALLDRATRMVLGFSVTFDVPTYAAVMDGIKHATYRKEISHIDGLKDEDWPCMGRIESLFIDNGLEFANTHLRTAAAQLGFQIFRLPPREPWLKGLVERFMGEAARFAHRLPGTTHCCRNEFLGRNLRKLQVILLQRPGRILFGREPETCLAISTSKGGMGHVRASGEPVGEFPPG